MRVLHTSDWHLGRNLHGRHRYDEFEQFLQWLGDTVVQQNIDTLLVAGDIFDTSTPNNRVQEMYYQFLKRITSTNNSPCRNIIITGGNHDSPTFLNAPKDLLKGLNIHIVGASTQDDDLAHEVIPLYDNKGNLEGLVCAVPYLRDRDIRTVEAFESAEDKVQKVVDGIKQHYHDVCLIAQKIHTQRTQHAHGDHAHGDHVHGDHVHGDHAQHAATRVPIIAMGHLFAAGGKTVEGDGVRDLYVSSVAHVGGLAQIRGEDFPPAFDYVALGHLHAPQVVGGLSHIRYCGSPLPMGFNEVGQVKSVVVVEFADHGNADHAHGDHAASTPMPMIIRTLPIPCFQVLERISGNMDVILGRIRQLKGERSTAWLEIEYTGQDAIIAHSGTLREIVSDALEGTAMEVRRIKNLPFMAGVMGKGEAEGVVALDDLSRDDVFERCLDAHEIPAAERPELVEMYAEIVRGLDEVDE